MNTKQIYSNNDLRALLEAQIAAIADHAAFAQNDAQVSYLRGELAGIERIMISCGLSDMSAAITLRNTIDDIEMTMVKDEILQEIIR